MSRGLNKVMIIGHLGKDPEMRLTPSGRAVTTLQRYNKQAMEHQKW
jgi:single-strand DNA-binding protein